MNYFFEGDDWNLEQRHLRLGNLINLSFIKPNCNIINANHALVYLGTFILVVEYMSNISSDSRRQFRLVIEIEWIFQKVNIRCVLERVFKVRDVRLLDSFSSITPISLKQLISDIRFQNKLWAPWCLKGLAEFILLIIPHLRNGLHSIFNLLFNL